MNSKPIEIQFPVSFDEYLLLCRALGGLRDSGDGESDYEDARDLFGKLQDQRGQHATSSQVNLK